MPQPRVEQQQVSTVRRHRLEKTPASAEITGRALLARTKIAHFCTLDVIASFKAIHMLITHYIALNFSLDRHRHGQHEQQ